jgi:hypothetical protein
MVTHYRKVLVDDLVGHDLVPLLSIVRGTPDIEFFGLAQFVKHPRGVQVPEVWGVNK